MAEDSLPNTPTYHLVKISANRKTGPIPVSTSPASTCPVSCQLTKVCYAKYGPLAIHWAHVNSGRRGVPYDQFLNQIRSLPDGQLWRHNVAGDLPGPGDLIDRGMLDDLVDANRNRRGFTYTHKPVLDNPQNAEAVRRANQDGFTINLSANSIDQADRLVNLEVGPVVVVLEADQKGEIKTPAGNSVAVCPNAIDRRITCKDCRLCQHQDRKLIIGFPVHGSGRKHFI